MEHSHLQKWSTKGDNDNCFTDVLCAPSSLIERATQTANTPWDGSPRVPISAPTAPCCTKSERLSSHSEMFQMGKMIFSVLTSTVLHHADKIWKPAGSWHCLLDHQLLVRIVCWPHATTYNHKPADSDAALSTLDTLTCIQCLEQPLALYVVTASHLCGSGGSQTTLVPSGLQHMVTRWPGVLVQVTVMLL